MGGMGGKSITAKTKVSEGSVQCGIQMENAVTGAPASVGH